MDSFRRLKSQWDRVAAIVVTIAGAAVLIIGYFGVSGQGLPAEQIPFIVSGGLGGIFLLGLGAALWLSADLRDEWKKLDRIETVLELGLEQLGLTRGDDNRPTVVSLARASALDPSAEEVDGIQLFGRAENGASIRNEGLTAPAVNRLEATTK